MNGISDLNFFVIFGLIILTLNIIGDTYYFWVNSFKDDLKMIIIEQEHNKVAHSSLRFFHISNLKYASNKIKSLHTPFLIKLFRGKFKVKNNLQFLIFG